MDPDELTDEELAEWRAALDEEHRLEALLNEARLNGDQRQFVEALNARDAASARAALLLADAVRAKRAAGAARRFR